MLTPRLFSSFRERENGHRQDLVEAKANVDKRMDFMKHESDRLDSSLKSLENKQLQAQQAVQSLNQKLQKFAPKQPQQED